MEEFKNRLLEYISGYLGISQRAFERECGIGQGVLSSIQPDGKGPGVAILLGISNRYPELNMNWLLAGRGPMILPPVQPQNSAPAVSIGSIQTVNIGNWDELVRPLQQQMQTIIDAINK